MSKFYRNKRHQKLANLSKVGVALFGLLAGGAAPKISPNLAPAPIEDMVNWENDNDYPSRAIREQRQGRRAFASQLVLTVEL
jgi:hypothetical protein